ncbi:hypothetical protein [Ruminococcus sp.]|uniref:hypothetical protein n=1 Tax=Ruminococcus sp. TaxID=41978 RepID=UPI00351FED75
MVKGFVYFSDNKIPFVIEGYRMELFSDEPILSDFCKENNYKDNYILYGQCLDNGFHGRNATFLVGNSIGSTCYLRCYIVNMFDKDEEYDTIGVQSPFLDDVFRYQYNYIDMVRQGINFSLEPREIYKIPFSMQDKQYELSYYIGYNNKLGLLEDYDKKGEIMIPLHNKTIQECLDISVVLNRLAMFMTSHSEVPFRRIILYSKEHKVGWFYCPLMSENAVARNDGFFYEFDVMKYIPKIIDNIALDSGNKITKSIPLGHLGDYESLLSPQRFIEQIMAFEYLFDKLEHIKAQNNRFSLKDELIYAFNWFPDLLSEAKESAETVSDNIKEIRRTITHGYAYYYDFKTDSKAKYYILLLDKLIKKMSLKWIGFSETEINNFLI